jgi:hypothetical protein
MPPVCKAVSGIVCLMWAYSFTSESVFNAEVYPCKKHIPVVATAVPFGLKLTLTLPILLFAVIARYAPETVSGPPSGESDMTQYLFNTFCNEHYFCKTCGIRAFGIGNPPGMGRVYGVNLGCLENATPEELSTAPIVYIDGKHDNWNSPPAITCYL